MARSDAATVTEYLAELPPERRKALAEVRRVVRKHLPKGYHEAMGFGMISWHVPLALYPETYNGQPLCYTALASQKNYNTLYLMPAYSNTATRQKLEDGFKAAGLRLDMGKSCIHFHSADELPLDLIGEIVASVPMVKWIAIADSAKRRTPRKRAAKQRPAAARR